MVMLSRVAENLYWLSRYLERAENTARLINVHASLILDLPKEVRPGWDSMLTITGSRDNFYSCFPSANESSVSSFLLSHPDNPGSIISSLYAARNNARMVRDIIPREAWEQINQLYQQTRIRSLGTVTPQKRYVLMCNVVLGVQQIAGIMSGAMSHDQGYEFLQLGKQLEQSDMTTRIVDVRWGDTSTPPPEMTGSHEHLLWMSVLKSLTAYQMYRRHCQSVVNREMAVHFLLTDRQFPRSVLFCLNRILTSLGNLPQCGGLLACLERLQSNLLDSRPDSLINTDLAAFMDDLQIQFGWMHQSICQCYFEIATQEQS